MLARLASIVRGQGKLCDIDEVGLDAVAFAQFTRDNARRVQAHATHSGCTQNDRDE